MSGPHLPHHHPLKTPSTVGWLQQRSVEACEKPSGAANHGGNGSEMWMGEKK